MVLVYNKNDMLFNLQNGSDGVSNRQNRVYD